MTGSQEEIRRLRDIIQAYESELLQAKALCARAADALEEAEPMVREPVPDTEMHSDWIKLIAELRKAAQ